MFNFLKNNPLLRVFGYSSTATIVQFITGFVTIKIIAHFLGTEGMALLGNFKNFNSSLKKMSTLGFDSGITKLISEHKDNSKKTNQIISTSLISRVGIAIVFSMLLVVFATYLNAELFQVFNFKYLIYALAISLPFYTVSALIIAVINGYQKFKHLITANIATSIIGLGISAILIWHHQLPGSILAIILIEGLSIGISYYFLKKSKISFQIQLDLFSNTYLKVLGQFSVMTLTSALIVPGSHFLIRNEIIDTLDIHSAGYWEALIGISNYYMLVITSVISMYYLPKLSSIHTTIEFKKELIIFFKTLVPLFILGITFLYFLREPVVLIVLNENFLPVADLFLWQLIGDLFNVLSLAFGYQILAKTMTKTYITVEIIFYSIYLLLVHFLLPKLDLNGVVISYAITSIISLIIMLFIFRKTLFSHPNRNERTTLNPTVKNNKT